MHVTGGDFGTPPTVCEDRVPMSESLSGGSMSPIDRDPGGIDRRDLLRWAGALGLAAVVPSALAACEPTPSTPQPLAPDAVLRGRGFIGGTDTVVTPGG